METHPRTKELIVGGKELYFGEHSLSRNLDETVRKLSQNSTEHSHLMLQFPWEFIEEKTYKKE